MVFWKVFFDVKFSFTLRLEICPPEPKLVFIIPKLLIPDGFDLIE